MMRNERKDDARSVPTGYQKTEVGVIPSDWELITYGDAFDFLTTATYSRAELSENDEVLYVHYGDIHTKWEHFLDFAVSNLPSIKNEQVKNYALIKDGDLLMADASEDYSGIGVSVEVKNISNKKAISGLHTYLLRDKKDIFSKGFKAYIHLNKAVKTQMDKLATGLKVYGVSRANLKIIQIPLPPTKAEQTAIATALSDMDALIAGLEKLLAKKRHIKQGAMQELLRPKEGWMVRVLHKIAEIDNDNLSSTTDQNYGFIYISLEDVDYGVLRNSTELTFKNAPSRARRRVKRNDILVSTVRPNLKSHLWIKNEVKNWICSTGFSVVRCKKGLADPGFIYNHLFAEIVNRQIDTVIAGSNYPAISGKDVKSLEIPLPPTIREQQNISAILSDMASEIEQLETQLSKHKLLKTGMMQELLTGKKRLV